MRGHSLSAPGPSVHAVGHGNEFGGVRAKLFVPHRLPHRALHHVGVPVQLGLQLANNHGLPAFPMPTEVRQLRGIPASRDTAGGSVVKRNKIIMIIITVAVVCRGLSAKLELASSVMVENSPVRTLNKQSSIWELGHRVEERVSMK